MRAVPGGDNDALVAAYLTEKTGATFEEGQYRTFAVLNDGGEFVGGVVVSNFRGTDCELSTAADTPFAFKPEVLRVIFDYVFNQLGCVRCTSITTKRNKRARSFLLGLGFELEGNLRLGYDGKLDALIYGLLASECRYIGDLDGHGEEIESSAAESPGPGSDG